MTDAQTICAIPRAEILGIRRLIRPFSTTARMRGPVKAGTRRANEIGTQSPVCATARAETSALVCTKGRIGTWI